MTPSRFEEVVVLSAIAAYTVALAPVLAALGKIASVMRPRLAAGVPAGRLCFVQLGLELGAVPLASVVHEVSASFDL
jgi:hypothetical protein